LDSVNTEDAIRRGQPGDYRRLSLPILSSIALPVAHSATCTFATALNRRVSGDSFGSPTNEELSDFLNDVFGVRFIDQKDRNRQKRCVASMGALHPTHCLLHRRGNGWHVYLAEEHSLGQLLVDEANSDRLLGLVDEHLQAQQAVVICLLSDCDLAANYYENYVPLLFRDAGVLLGHAGLVAAAHGLSFRILGRTGTAVAESLVKGLSFRALATGLALLGSKIAPTPPQPCGSVNV
jgi:hypothetical protein